MNREDIKAALQSQSDTERDTCPDCGGDCEISSKMVAGHVETRIYCRCQRAGQTLADVDW